MARAYGVTAMDPDASNYQSVLSIEVAAVFGRGWFYYLTMGGVLAALSFSANTAFADFPTHGTRDCGAGLSAACVFAEGAGGCCSRMEFMR